MVLKTETTFTSAYSRLRERIEPKTWEFFGAVSVLGDSVFSDKWAAAAAGTSRAEARHHLSCLHDYYLVREVGPKRGRRAHKRVKRPSFCLDAQAVRVAKAIASYWCP